MARKQPSEKEIVISTPAPSRRKASPPRAKRAVAVPETAPTEVSAVERALPSSDQIAALAYSYWIARGYQGGSPEADWLRAEQELSQQFASTATA